MKKLLSILMSSLLMAFSGVNVYAAVDIPEYERPEGLRAEFSLSELEGMSKEDFLTFNNAENIYNDIVYYANTNNSINYTFVCNTMTSAEYNMLESERMITKLLGDKYDYEIISPVLPSDILWNWMLTVHFPSIIDSSVTDDSILFVAKVQYCLNQICEFDYLANPIETTPYSYGEANNDDKLDIRDASFIAQKLAAGKSEELPATADFNADGVTDVRDAAGIARLMTARSAAKIEGLI